MDSADLARGYLVGCLTSRSHIPGVSVSVAARYPANTSTHSFPAESKTVSTTNTQRFHFHQIATPKQHTTPHHLHPPPIQPIMADDDGATPKELLLESCRRNNTTLLTTLLSSPPFSNSPSSTAAFLNTTTDALGSSALHVAAQYGSYEVLDIILDQEGVEIDGQERREGDTCLHKAVRYANGLEKAEWEAGRAVVDILVDAGCDPR